MAGKCHDHRASAAVPAVNVSAGPDQAVPVAAGLTAGLLLLLLLLGLALYLLWKKKKKQEKGRSWYQELPSALAAVPECSAPVIPVSQNSWVMFVSHHDASPAFLLTINSFKTRE